MKKTIPRIAWNTCWPPASVFEFKRDYDEVRRIDGLIAVEKEECEKAIRSLERQRSATANALVRAQKDLAEVRRENDDDDTVRRRVADLDRQISDRNAWPRADQRRR